MATVHRKLGVKTLVEAAQLRDSHPENSSELVVAAFRDDAAPDSIVTPDLRFDAVNEFYASVVLPGERASEKL